MQDVSGKSAFITGGASGIGLGMAEVFARNGMRVVIADIDSGALERAVRHLADAGCAAHPIQLDVTQRAEFARAADEAERAVGKLHVLCNNAGLGITGSIKDATYDDWDWMRGVLLDGVVNGVQTILPRIRAHGEGGHIVNTGSMSGVFASSNSGIYITMKYAVVGMAEALRWELQGENIGVSAFLAGPARTNIMLAHRRRPAGMVSGYAREDARREELAEALQAPLDDPRRRALDVVMMDPVEVGERVLRGIRRNDLFIITHPEFREGVVARNEALLRAFPDEPTDERRLEQLRQTGTLLRQPIYATQTTPRGKPTPDGRDS